MGGVPLTLRSHTQKVETIGRSLTSLETYFICTNVSAIGAELKNWECKTAMNSDTGNKFWVK